MQSADVSAFPQGCFTHRYDSKCPLPSPESKGEKKNIWNLFHNLSSELQGQATGKTRTRQELISSVSPSPLTVRVALAVTCYLADTHGVQLQNQIWCGIRSTVGQTHWRTQNKAFQISLLKDQTVKGDHADMFWARWNTEPLLYTDIKNFKLPEIPEKKEKVIKHIPLTLSQYCISKKTLSHSWVRCWTQRGVLNLGLSLLMKQVTYAVILGGLADLSFLNKPLSWNIIMGCHSAYYLPVRCESVTVCTIILDATTILKTYAFKIEPMIFPCSNNICITVLFDFLQIVSFSHTKIHTLTCVRVHTNTHWLAHTAVFYLPGSSRRYSVNFNTQILDILYGCELLSNSNWCLASAHFAFLPAGSLSQKEFGQASPTHIGYYCPL